MAQFGTVRTFLENFKLVSLKLVRKGSNAGIDPQCPKATIIFDGCLARKLHIGMKHTARSTEVALYKSVRTFSGNIGPVIHLSETCSLENTEPAVLDARKSLLGEMTDYISRLKSVHFSPYSGCENVKISASALSENSVSCHVFPSSVKDGQSSGNFRQRRLPVWKSLHSSNMNILVQKILPSLWKFGKQDFHTDVSSSSHSGDLKKEMVEKSDTIEQLKLDYTEDVIASKLAEEIVRKASQVDVMVGSVPFPQVEELVLTLLNCGLQPSHVLSVLSNNPTYILSQHKLLNAVNLLLTYGFNPQQVFTILQHFQPIVRVSPSQISHVIDTLRTGNFNERSISKIVTGNPSVLHSAESTLLGRLSQLRQLFSSADVIKMTVNSPVILTQEWEELEAKFKYVFHKMNITQRQMVFASLFSHSLSHIQKRHVFLIRAGLYCTAKRKEGEKNPNPSLDQIIDISDQNFCLRHGGFDVKEYRTFCLLFDKEIEQLSDSDTDEES